MNWLPDIARKVAMRETLICDDFRVRRIAGICLIAICLPLSVLVTWITLLGSIDIGDFLLVGAGLLVTLAVFWAAFPRGDPKIHLRLTEADLHFPLEGNSSISLDRLQSIRITHPIHLQHARLTFVHSDGESVRLDVNHLTHEAKDIINLVGLRLEQVNRHLVQGMTEVMGAPNGIWEVREGLPFEVLPASGRMRHGTEQNPSKPAIC